MKKLIDFEYDLWTAEDGRCMVRVRRTGEECEVDRETFRLLRAEEKRLRRERTPEKKGDIQGKMDKNPLSLDIFDTDSEGDFWHIDPQDMEEGMITKLMVEEFLTVLTPHQADVFRCCIMGRMGKSEYAVCRGVSPASVSKAIRKIQVAAKKFFGGG